MALRLYTTKDPEVRKVSREVTPEELKTDEMQQFIDELVIAMDRFDGIGIAACQVGKNLRIFVVTKDHAGTTEDLVLVNPRLVSASEKTTVLEQGCLSVPHTFGPVERPRKVRVKALLRDGTPTDIKAKGMFAQILQHELDHLDATLFIDKALSITKTDE